MSLINIIIIRIVLSVIVSMLICKAFFQELQLIKIAGLSVLFFSLAYLFQYLRNIGKKDQ